MIKLNVELENVTWKNEMKNEMSQAHAAHCHPSPPAFDIKMYAENLVERLMRAPVVPGIERIFELYIAKPRQSMKEISKDGFAGGLSCDIQKMVASGRNQNAAIRKAFLGGMENHAGMGGMDAWEIYAQEIDVQRSGLLVSGKNIDIKSRDPFEFASMSWTNVFVRRSRLLDISGATLIDWFDDRVRYGVGFGAKRIQCVDRGDFRADEYLERLQQCRLLPSSFSGSADFSPVWQDPALDPALEERCAARLLGGNGDNLAWLRSANELDRALSCVGLTCSLGLNDASSLVVLLAAFLEAKKATANGVESIWCGPLKAYLDRLPGFCGTIGSMHSEALMQNYASSEVAARDYVLSLDSMVHEQHGYRVSHLRVNSME